MDGFQEELPFLLFWGLLFRFHVKFRGCRYDIDTWTFQRGAKWFRFRVSIHHPLGFNWHPLEAAGKNVIFIICGWDSPNRKMLFIILVVFFHPGRGMNMVEFSFCSHVKSRINQLEVSSSMYD